MPTLNEENKNYLNSKYDTKSNSIQPMKMHMPMPKMKSMAAGLSHMTPQISKDKVGLITMQAGAMGIGLKKGTGR